MLLAVPLGARIGGGIGVYHCPAMSRESLEVPDRLERKLVKVHGSVGETEMVLASATVGSVLWDFPVVPGR